MKLYKKLANGRTILRTDTNTSFLESSIIAEANQYLQWLSEGNTPDIEEPVVDPQVAIKIQERMALENEYLECSRQICLWAGDQLADGIYPKLSNIDFKIKSQLAVTNMKEEANRIITTMTWCLFELQMNYNWKWEQIEYRSNI